MSLTVSASGITFDDLTTLSTGSISAANIAVGSISTLLLSAQAVTTDKLAYDGGSFCFRNKLINGDFRIWQRGTTFTNINAAYTADRWRFDKNTNDTVSFSRQAFALGQTDVPGEPTYFIRASITAGNTGSLNDFRQLIEDVRTLAGKTLTLSYWIRGSTSATIPSGTQRIGQEFGTGGSPSTAVTIATGAVNVTTSWQKIVRTVTLASLQGKTLGTDNNNALDIVISLPCNITMTVDIANVQLEEGSVPTPFELRPIGTELSLCQRYYYKSPTDFFYDSVGSGYNTLCITRYAYHINAPLPVEMRANPIVTLTFKNTAGTDYASNFERTVSSTTILRWRNAYAGFNPPGADVYMSYTASAEL